MSVAGYFEDFRLGKGGATFWAHVMDGELARFHHKFALNFEGGKERPESDSFFISSRDHKIPTMLCIFPSGMFQSN
jgi:hypothetical protein